MMKKRIWRTLSALLTVILLALPLCAAAEEDYWICMACGQGGNTGDVCFRCGSERPVVDENFNESLTRIPGETDRVSVDILRIDGSAYVKGKKDKYLYAPWKATDEDPATCWQFSAKNVKKKPAWLSLVIDGQTVDEIWIRNGFQGFSSKGKYQYPEYARAKDIQVFFCYEEEGSEAATMDFTLSDENGGDWEKLDTGRHEHVYEVIVEISSVYKGKSHASSACLSEIMVVQNAPAEYAKDPLE